MSAVIKLGRITDAASSYIKRRIHCTRCKWSNSCIVVRRRSIYHVSALRVHGQTVCFLMRAQIRCLKLYAWLFSRKDFPYVGIAPVAGLIEIMRLTEKTSVFEGLNARQAVSQISLPPLHWLRWAWFFSEHFISNAVKLDILQRKRFGSSKCRSFSLSR